MKSNAMKIKITRRKFLVSAAAAGAGLCLTRHALAAQPKAEPNRWLLMADIHVPADREKLNHGVKAAKNMELAVEQILKLAPRPAGMIVAGDCAFNEGQSGDYATLGESVKPLESAGVPVHFALGNHDHRARFLAALPTTRQRATVEPAKMEKLVTVLETPHADWYLLDSNNPPDGTAGRFGLAQLDWLAHALDARPEKPALLVAHHNPDADHKNSGLFDTDEFYKVIMPRRQVKAYLFGHQHCWGARREGELYLVNLPGNVWLFDQNQPRGFVTAELRPGGATLEMHALDGKHPKHGEKTELKWRG